ncbi:MAG: hypothetical protein ACR2RB_06820 [Gammaproteobacteria bacterium]
MNIRQILLAAVLVLCGAAASAMNDFTEAEQVLDQYFQGLASGDTTLIQKMLAGELLHERGDLLAVAGYDTMLRERYNGARFDIRSFEATDDDAVIANVDITFASNHAMSVSFVLRKQLPSAGAATAYRIVSESP